MNSTTEAQYNSAHAAKRKKMEELEITNTDPRILKLVGYYTEFSHSGA